VKRQREEFCNYEHLTITTTHRNILAECKNLKIPINKPKDISAFFVALQTVKSQKKKAANLLFEEIEQDVKDKEKFVLE
jgi:hypothetical protein